MGHVRDLPKTGLAVDIEDGSKPSHETLADKRKTVSELRKAAREANEVLLATDPDSEGEAIAWHVVVAAGIPRTKARRVACHEITQRKGSGGPSQSTG